MIETSAEITELATALALAALDIENAEKNHKAKILTKTGGSFEYSYPDLGAVLAIVRPALAKQGLVLMGQPKREGTQVSFAPRLLHKSGQWIQYEALTLEARAIDPQSIGSAITYCRRYSITAIFNMASESDDDGAKASGKNMETANGERQKETLPADNMATENDAKILMDWKADLAVMDSAEMLNAARDHFAAFPRSIKVIGWKLFKDRAEELDCIFDEVNKEFLAAAPAPAEVR